MAKMTDVSDATFDRDVIQPGGMVLVDFWAVWCVPCRGLAPILEKVAEEYTGRLTVVKFNVDENKDVPARYGVRGLPTLMLFKDGKVVEILAGLQSREAILKAIDKHV